MRRYYSIEAWSRSEVAFPEHLIALGPGNNVFTLSTEDIEEVLRKFCSLGVRIDKVNPLNGLAAQDRTQHPALIW